MKDDFLYEISIIVPFYNSSDTIKNTIYSLSNQTDKNFQVIFVNDGSTDNTIDIIKKENIKFDYKIINKDNGGVSSSRNIGIKEADGKYICFLDSDDCIRSNMIQELKNIINNKEQNIFLFEWKMISGFDEYIYYNREVCVDLKNIEDYVFVESSDEVIKKYFKKEKMIHICSIVFNRNFILENNIKFNENLYYAEDINFFITAFIRSENIIVIKRTYFYYINNLNSAMKKFNIKRITGIYAIKDLLCKSSDENIKILIENRYSEEILYISIGYILYCENKNYDDDINKIIDDSKKILRKYKIKSYKDIELFIDMLFLKKGIGLFRKYYIRKIYVLNKLNIIKNFLRRYLFGKQY
ncbi:glycosyltransferase family 2 protein [Clostridium perfringens]|uniref:glycosyltransferase family 2 protein n=3 Tax=Clostridium perfringens TaxID=1502 RepID=UPI002AC653C0|nr:glycosyltransferase family 2 protein [Clostridium perfringens]MDK0606751.1 glycosyltransferase family 2 protein [Clostridium perfringens]MDZ5031030.1 glycosyltransferase [Clostridium perfringens]